MIDTKKMQGELRAHWSLQHGALYWINNRRVTEGEWRKTCDERYGHALREMADKEQA